MWVIFSLRGAVRFAGSERLTGAVTRELGLPNLDDPGSGKHADACAVVFSLRDVYSLNKIARRIHENIKCLLSDERSVVIIDPSGVLQIDTELTGKMQHLSVVETEAEAREFIGGVGCSTLSRTDNW
jgi:glutaminase